MSHSSPATLKSIAEKLGLSIGTVQRALHNKGGYSQETQALVLAEAKRCGYSTNAAAASLRRSPMSLAVILPEPKGYNKYYFSYIWQGIERACNELSIYHIKLTRRYTNVHSKEAVSILEELLNSSDEHIDGLITIASSSASFSALLNRFYEKGIPVFIINDAGANEHPLRFSTNVSRDIGKLGADILAAIHSHSTGRVILLGGTRENTLHQTRAADFYHALTNRCPQLSIMEFNIFDDISALETTLRQILTGFDDIVAVYAASSRETLCLCETVKTLSLSQKITTIGMDVFPDLLPYFEDGTLTASIYQYPVQSGYLAVKTMANHILDIDKTYRQPVVPVTAVFRSNAKSFCYMDTPLNT